MEYKKRDKKFYYINLLVVFAFSNLYVTHFWLAVI